MQKVTEREVKRKILFLKSDVRSETKIIHGGISNYSAEGNSRSELCVYMQLCVYLQNQGFVIMCVYVCVCVLEKGKKGSLCVCVCVKERERERERERG